MSDARYTRDAGDNGNTSDAGDTVSLNLRRVPKKLVRQLRQQAMLLERTLRDHVIEVLRQVVEAGQRVERLADGGLVVPSGVVPSEGPVGMAAKLRARKPRGSETAQAQPTEPGLTSLHGTLDDGLPQTSGPDDGYRGQPRAVEVEPTCRRCGHLERQHMAQGCVGTCACSTKKFAAET